MAECYLQNPEKDSMFNIRIYGLLINPKNEVLLSFEQYKGQAFTKFPGGGMELGEGTIDALKREFEEELGICPQNIRHFYTTDFYQKSILDNSQIISIYYLVDVLDGQAIPEISDTGRLYFHPINADLVNKVNLPIDNVVAEMLLKTFTNTPI